MNGRKKKSGYDKDIASRVAATIRDWMEKSDYKTWRQVARASGVAGEHISVIVNGHTMPSVKTMILLCRAFGKLSSDLLKESKVDHAYDPDRFIAKPSKQARRSLQAAE